MFSYERHTTIMIQVSFSIVSFHGQLQQRAAFCNQGRSKNRLICLSCWGIGAKPVKYNWFCLSLVIKLQVVLYQSCLWSFLKNGGGLEGRQYLWEILSTEFGNVQSQTPTSNKTIEAMYNCPFGKLKRWTILLQTMFQCNYAEDTS